MPTKKKVDYKKLLKTVESGKHQADIIKEFKFNTASQFKNHYLTALIEAGRAPQIQTSRASAKKTLSKEALVGKSGSVVIPKALIEEMGFTEGEKFGVRKTKAGISLKKL
jgi:hypothetical protein